LPVTIETRDVATWSADHGMSIEEGARAMRFAFFEEVAGRTGIRKLALAHNADDQVETFLMRLLRGSGAPGLVGIWPDRKIGSLRVIRPMLEIRRREIADYLTDAHCAWREDESNLDKRFTRNRIRHELLPLLEREFNPSVRDVLCRTAEILRDEDYYLLHHVAQRFYMAACREDAVNVQALAGMPVAVQRRVLRFWLGNESELGRVCGFEQIEAIRRLALDDNPSAETHLPDDLVVYREYEWLRKTPQRDLVPLTGSWPLRIPGSTTIRDLGVTIHAETITASPGQPLHSCYTYNKDANSRAAEVFDAGALGDRLTVRTWREGDRFRGLGMAGEKKLQDFFVDEKVPRRQRLRVPLVCASDGRIAWVAGYRMADVFKVTEATKSVVQLRLEKHQVA
jgi:tRNA(Ile)-lysidine synthase